METTLKTLTNHAYLICSSEDYLADGRCLKSAHIRSLFWSTFSRIRTEYGEIWNSSPHSVQMSENADQNSSE